MLFQDEEESWIRNSEYSNDFKPEYKAHKDTKYSNSVSFVFVSFVSVSFVFVSFVSVSFVSVSFVCVLYDQWTK